MSRVHLMQYLGLNSILVMDIPTTNVKAYNFG